MTPLQKLVAKLITVGSPPKYRWDVYVRTFTYGGGAQFWAQAKYGKSPSAALTTAELCAWVQTQLQYVQIKVPGSVSTYFQVDPSDWGTYVRITARGEDYGPVTWQGEGWPPNVLASLGCG